MGRSGKGNKISKAKSSTRSSLKAVELTPGQEQALEGARLISSLNAIGDLTKDSHFSNLLEPLSDTDGLSAEEAVRANLLMSIFDDIKSDDLFIREGFNGFPIDKGFSIYPFPVSVNDKGEVIDPNGNVIDQLSIDKTPNLLLALAREQQYRTNGKLLDNIFDNNLTAAAYEESGFYQNGLTVERQLQNGQVRKMPAKTKEVLDKDGNVIFKRFVGGEDNTPGLIKEEDFYSEVIQRIGRENDGVDLSGWRLRESSYRGRDMNGFKLDGTDLSNSNFNNASLNDWEVSRSDMSYSNFKRASFNNCNINWCDFSNSEFSSHESDERSSFNNSIIRASFDKSRMQYATINNSDLDESSFEGVDFGFLAEIKDSSIKGCSFDSVSGDELRMKKVDARGLKANGMKITDPEIAESDFSNSFMPGVSFADGAFNRTPLISDTSFKNAVMPGAYIAGLREVEFVRETIPKSDSDRVHVDREGTGVYDRNGRGLNFNGAQMQHSKIEGSEIRESSFDNAALQGSTITDCDLNGTSFVGADVSGVRFQGVRNLDLTGAINADQAIIEPLNENNSLYKNSRDSVLDQIKPIDKTITVNGEVRYPNDMEDYQRVISRS